MTIGISLGAGSNAAARRRSEASGLRLALQAHHHPTASHSRLLSLGSCTGAAVTVLSNRTM
jgi:hypothetical protein